MAKTKSLTKIISAKAEPARFSYAHVFEPKAINDGDEKYSVSILIDKTHKSTLSRIAKAIKAAIAEGEEKHGKKWSKGSNFKLPLRDGDEERDEDEAYEGMYFLNANSKRKPQIVDAELNPITDEDDFYSGCYGRFSVNFFPYNSNGNKGVGVGLNNIQKLKDGERLSGSSSAFDDFDDEDEDEDDDLI